MSRSGSSMIQHIEELYVAGLQRYQEKEDMWNERRKVEISALSKQLEGPKQSQKQYTMLLKQLGGQSRHFEEQKEQYRAKLSEETAYNRYLLGVALEEKTERMKLEENYSLCGALERMVCLAEWQKKIPPTGETQQGLDKLAQMAEFTMILDKEVQARQLDVKDVIAAASHLYQDVSRSPHQKGVIIVMASEYPDNTRAALVIFLKLQSNWPRPLDWWECPLRK
ncbi:hypothetical protein B9Z19DRAFT_1069985 [Tuber borchii]|uniref:Uncharacterized protein n=1 Tax=Tuber borchii TaxID=42251 RepID=A0A2T6Z9J5_TUBBO|nr:hypothetical protein B9Z19DRAFT_1069985 [Tuber borchii]